MAVLAAVQRGRAARALRAVVLALPRGITRLRRSPPPERAALAALVALSLLTLVAGRVLGPGLVPPVFQVVPLLGGGLLLRRAQMRQLLVVVAACLLYEVADRSVGLSVVRPGALVVVLVTAVVSYEFARSREETGLTGSSGDTFVMELRERLQRQGEMPALPRGWQGEAVLSPAGGGPFAGDFVVSARSEDGRRLEIALVDVSGKGVEAGTRALLLSGALGGLLGSPDPHHFLVAGNRYLDRQSWEEGFATAVHVVVHLDDGHFAVRSAGHPPAAMFDAGSGRWSLLQAEGVALGLLPEATYQPLCGRLEPGDALLLYTDGLVEVAGRDLSVGIDKLLGEAERLVPRGFRGGGLQLVSKIASAGTDDRGLVLLWRDA